MDVRGSDPSLLLINGVGGGRALWGPLRDRLPVGTVAYDAPGCGHSPPARGPLSVHDHAKIAAAVVRALDMAEVDVLGFSFGGLVAQELARHSARGRAPRVRRLVLVATGCGLGSWPGSPLAYALLASPQVVTSPAHARQVAPYLFGGAAGRSGGAAGRGGAPAARFVELLRQRVDPVSYYGQLHAAMTWTSAHWLAGLPQTALVVAGDDDPLVPVANAALLATLLRDVTGHVVRGGGHLLLVDDVDEVAQVVERFLLAPDRPTRRRPGA